jgi:hypothetical protein
MKTLDPFVVLIIGVSMAALLAIGAIIHTIIKRKKP